MKVGDYLNFHGVIIGLRKAQSRLIFKKHVIEYL
jgi:hypothetical protein